MLVIINIIWGILLKEVFSTVFLGSFINTKWWMQLSVMKQWCVFSVSTLTRFGMTFYILSFFAFLLIFFTNAFLLIRMCWLTFWSIYLPVQIFAIPVYFNNFIIGYRNSTIFFLAFLIMCSNYSFIITALATSGSYHKKGYHNLFVFNKGRLLHS